MFSLRETGLKVGYSKSERDIFSLLPQRRGEKITSVDLAEKFYRAKGKKEVPFNGRTAVVQMVTRLSTKAIINKEPFSIKKSERSGPHPVYFWVEH